MKLQQYTPTARGILFKEVVKEKTETGIYYPTKGLQINVGPSMFDSGTTVFDGAKSKLGDYVVIKVGKDVQEIIPDDIILLTDGVTPVPITLDDDKYLQVIEFQVIGYEREDAELSLADFKTGKEELGGIITEEELMKIHGGKRILT